ncbi:Plastocyanin [Blastococcus aurantiacus]|uniref:Plastocyanin n=1 Tax=Blastococcus aurantiacus TaxID=1550231 RepID=A0A1G7R969_9ACTN|nr:plastocyanin/azurin family copper-binding protein [Blastococcus aurantiacus]SDG07224.1 Plastocyanin [Blastococcus aurantiacus]
MGSTSSPGIPRRAVLIGGLAGLGTLALAACGGDSKAPESSDDAPQGDVTVQPDGAQEITVVVRDDYVFYPSAFTVTTGLVRITVTSEAEQMVHNLVFTPGAGPVEIDEGISILPAGTTDTFEFTVERPGDYGFECSFHAALGQIGTMTVTAV